MWQGLRVVGREYQISLLLDLADTDRAFLRAQKQLLIELGGTWAGVTIPARQARVQDNTNLLIALPRTVPAATIKQLQYMWPEAITQRLRGALRDRRLQGYRAGILPSTHKVPQPR